MTHFVEACINLGMKFFLKLKVGKGENRYAVHYFLPDIEKTIHVGENDYAVSFNSSRGEHSFSIDRKGQYLGEFFNDIAPRQSVQLEDGEWAFSFSLLPAWRGKSAVKRFLKARPDTMVQDMKDFYLFTGNRKAYRRYNTCSPKGDSETSNQVELEQAAIEAKKE